MFEKEYYYYGNSEFMTGLGVIYTEFTGQRASRQINVLNGHSYASSCLQDYVPEVGFLLYDGRKDELDLSDSIKISQRNLNEFGLRLSLAVRMIRNRQLKIAKYNPKNVRGV